MEERKVCWPLKFSDNKLSIRGREMLAVSDTWTEVLREELIMSVAKAIE